ncbi:hypothetical protein BH24ACT5_BH24ACT5_17390 [soil metagenome]
MFSVGRLWRLSLAVGVGVLAFGANSSPGWAQEPPDAPPTGRTPLVQVPVGCPIGQLPDVVFVGTLQDSDFRTARIHVDQVRAGDMSQFAVGELVDVRYDIDTKYLRQGRRYLIGAAYDGNAGVLRSKVQPAALTFGGDEVIGAAEIDLDCPEVDDAIMTMLTDGRSVDSGLLTPLLDDRQGLLGVLMVPMAAVLGGVFALAAVRWVFTGFTRGVEAAAARRARTRRPPRPERPRPVVATAGASPGGQGSAQRGRSAPPPPDGRRNARRRSGRHRP